jgi:hypothetical protein
MQGLFDRLGFIIRSRARRDNLPSLNQGSDLAENLSRVQAK